eukprot:CAMPEP_0206532168 /NCGR_PEP_ID=MMETSP0325_2-20121206/4199_1 /ASSEMBLY_ACC=CAM_ASM_000347 /TAXON_ID=2866 /ORGANISM="Crypthecodinium cohnii, Strain Seligo" /LENGTH=359 /DNA_ID=CAMNT_0054028549 /DNA_START=17 /DNA_END=1096 /DNA_ORIENTATION=-
MSSSNPSMALAASAGVAGLAAGVILTLGALGPAGRAQVWRRVLSSAGLGGNTQLMQRLDPSKAIHREWLSKMKAFIFDIDGVVHVAGHAVPGSPEALAALNAAGKRVIYMTNNATVTPESIAATFEGFGAQAKPEQMMTSAIAAARYLKAQGLEGRKVYVIGMDSMAAELRLRAGVVTFGASEDANKGRPEVEAEFKSKPMDPPLEEVAAVVVGADYLVNYYKLARAANYLRQNPKCLFVATNPDPRAPLGKSAMIPAAGTLVQALATACGRQPTMMCGKPSKDLASYLLESEGLDPSTTCMVGDRTDTDIEFGRSVGMQTLWVESGSMTLDEVEAVGEGSQPHFVAPSIATLTSLLKQ